MRLLLIVIFILWVAAALGQSAPTQSFSIIVSDENGVAIPSARVRFEKPATAPIDCETNFSGRCRFLSPPPGTYTLRIEKEGFYALLQPQVEITAGSSLEVTLSHLQEVRENIDVHESTPAIDSTQTASQQSISGIDMLNIPYPATHDYRNVLNFIPGVVQDQGGQPHIAGGQTYQAVTLLDGFNVTQPANGQLLVRVSTDAFRSIQVEPSRVPAEYGKGSAGVLLLNTGIGDDHFRFAGTDFIPSFQQKNGWRFDQFLPRLTFSGPIRKGKMWFYNAFDGEYDNFVFPELPKGQDNDHVLRFGNLAKVQTNITSRNIFTTSFLVNHLHDQYAFLSPQSPQLANPKDVEGAYIASVKDQHYFAGGELFEAGLAFDQYNVTLTPYGTTSYEVTPFTNFGNYYLGERTHARRWQAISNLYLPPEQWHGRHDFKFGVDFDRISYDAQFSRQPISFLAPTAQGPLAGVTCLTAPQDASFPCTRYSTFTDGPFHHQYNAEISAYVQDRWLIADRLLVEPGLRIDWDEIVRKPLFSPRLAGTFAFGDSGNTKISAGVGLIYNATPIFLIARPFAGTRQDFFFSVDPNCTAPTGCVSTSGPVETTFSVNTHTLQGPRSFNWSLALEQKLPAAIYLKAEFLEKRGNHGFVYNNATGSIGGNFLLENTRVDQYDSLQFTLRHSFRGGYMLMGSYTRSRAHTDQALDFNVDSPVLSPQQSGPYPWDTPNRFLSWGYFPFFRLPIIHQTEIVYSTEARTGFPFNLVNDQQQLIAPPGSHRFPEYFALNLQLEKRFHFLGYYFAVRGGFDNITNHRNPFFVNSTVDPLHPGPTFAAFQGRSFTSRIRLLGKK